MSDLDLEATALSATTSSLEFAALGADVGARAGVRLSGSLAEVTVGRTGCTATLHQDGVLSLGRLESQLIESHDFTTRFQNTFAGASGDMHSAQGQLRDLVQTEVIRNSADDNGSLSIASWLLHHARDARDGHGWPVHPAHIETLQNDLVKLGICSAGQESVELDQQTQVDILALGLRSASLSHVLVTDVDSHLYLLKVTFKPPFYVKPIQNFKQIETTQL